MKIINDNEKIEAPLNFVNRFVEINHQWYELVSLHIDIVSERISIVVNTGHFEDKQFIIDKKHKGLIQNQSESTIIMEENLVVEDQKIKTSKRVHNYREMKISNSDNEVFNKITPVDDYTFIINKSNNKNVKVRYKAKTEVLNDYNLFMQEMCTRNTLTNNILGCIKRLFYKGTIKWS